MIITFTDFKEGGEIEDRKLGLENMVCRSGFGLGIRSTVHIVELRGLL